MLPPAAGAAAKGRRISEWLALRWVDVDWLRLRLSVDRRHCQSECRGCKTVESRRDMPLDPTLMDVLKAWKQATMFAAPSDWDVRFARSTRSAALVLRPGLACLPKGRFGSGNRQTRCAVAPTHVLVFVGQLGTPLAVQQKLMHHTDIRTTMNVYGNVITNRECTSLATNHVRQ
jgi:integrase